MEKIYERYNLRIEKIYNIFLSEQKGGATTDSPDESSATTDIIKSASDFKLKSDITSLQPIESIFTEIEKDKSAEVDKIHNRVNSKSAETINPKFSEYEPKIIELEKGKELDKLDKNIINDGDKIKSEVDYKFEYFKKLFEQDKTKDVPREYFNLSSKCLTNILDNKYDYFDLEKEFVIEESKNNCFVCGEDINNIFFHKDEVSQLLNINTKGHKKLEYLNFIRCHKNCKIHTNLGIDKLDFNNGKLLVKDLGEINEIIEEQIGGNTYEWENIDKNKEIRLNNNSIIDNCDFNDFNDEEQKEIKNKINIDAEIENIKFKVYFKTLRQSMDFFFTTNSQISSLRHYCIRKNFAQDRDGDLVNIDIRLPDGERDINYYKKKSLKRFLLEFYFTNNPVPCYLKDFNLVNDATCIDLDLESLRKNKRAQILQDVYIHTKVGDNLLTKFNLRDFNYDNYKIWLDKRYKDLVRTIRYYENNKQENPQIDDGKGPYDIEHSRPHLVAIKEGRLFLPILYKNPNITVKEQYNDYINKLDETKILRMVSNFFKCCKPCNNKKNVIDDDIKKTIRDDPVNILRHDYEKKMILSVNDEYYGVIFSIYNDQTKQKNVKTKQKNEKFFYLIKKDYMSNINRDKIFYWLKIAMDASKELTLSEQFNYILKNQDYLREK